VTSKPFCIGLLSFIAAFGSACDGSGKPFRLHRVQCLGIDRSQDSICLFRDPRLDSATMNSLWSTGQDSGHAQAEVRRISPAGKILAILTLNPLARLANARFSGKQFALATEDFSIGSGSYNGPLTHVLDLSQPGRIDMALYKGGREIAVMSSMKTIWKTVPDGFLEAACRPDTVLTEDSTGFIIYYQRIRYSNGAWVHAERSERGYSDFEEDFPQDSLFPN